MKFRVWLYCLSIAIPNLSSAEILQNIYPLDTLGVIKAKYPNGLFQKVNAAWVTPDDAFFEMSGQGFPGKLFLKFSDGRPAAKKYIAEQCPDQSNRTKALLCELKQSSVSSSDEDALEIDWVRWVPAEPIPMARYISKYGEPKFDLNSTTMSPSAYWYGANLSAELTADKKLVNFVTTSFTRAEQRQAWQLKFKFVPPELQDQTPEPQDSTVKPRRSPPKKTL
ncbi:hypothetical protein BH11PSE7_BH11PSE7_30260 [soil metagenome]